MDMVRARPIYFLNRVVDYIRKTALETGIELYMSKLYDGVLDNQDIEIHLAKLELLLASAEKFNRTSIVPINTIKLYESLDDLRNRYKETT